MELGERSGLQCTRGPVSFREFSNYVSEFFILSFTNNHSVRFHCSFYRATVPGLTVSVRFAR